MSAVAFDTLKFARTLRERANLSTEQAEGLAQAMVEVLDGNLATKADIREVRADIEALKIQTRADIEALRLTTRADLDAHRRSMDAALATVRLSMDAGLESLRLSTKADIESVRGEIANAKVETVRWLVGAAGFQTLAVLGAVIALARTLH